MRKVPLQSFIWYGLAMMEEDNRRNFRLSGSLFIVLRRKFTSVISVPLFKSLPELEYIGNDPD